MSLGCIMFVASEHTRRQLPLITLLVLGCRFGNQDTGEHAQRIVCLSKQYNEIIYGLGAEKDLVAVDLSSTYPPAIKSLTTVGYHRALTAEGIAAVKPTLILHDNNVGPEHVMRQLADLHLPMKGFATKGEDIPTTKALFREMGAYFHKEDAAERMVAKLDSDMAAAHDGAKRYAAHPKVVVIHFGRANNV